MLDLFHFRSYFIGIPRYGLCWSCLFWCFILDLLKYVAPSMDCIRLVGIVATICRTHIQCHVWSTQSRWHQLKVRKDINFTTKNRTSDSIISSIKKFMRRRRHMPLVINLEIYTLYSAVLEWCDIGIKIDILPFIKTLIDTL